MNEGKLFVGAAFLICISILWGVVMRDLTAMCAAITGLYLRQKQSVKLAGKMIIGRTAISTQEETTMNKDEWIKRCAVRYEEKGGLDKEQAIDAAHVCFEEQEGDFFETKDYSPEASADEDMSYWSSDHG